MKTLSRLTVLLVVSSLALAATASVALGAGRLVYSDEFNGPLDTASWSNNTPWNTHTDTIQLSYYDPANCTFSGGTMTLKSENRATHGYPYASGVVTSLPCAKFSYGYFEIRARLPKGPGIWPAFWLTNDHSLEIDGLEMLGDRPTRIYQTLHENDSQIYQGIHDGPDYSADFHTYGIDWQPSYVKWYIDGVLTTTYAHAVPADPMWICLNTAVGGSWPGSPTAATSFPANYDIDYVRVYDTKPVAGMPPVVTADSSSTPVYRFYNKKNGSHFYTASAAEYYSVFATLGDTYGFDGVAYTIDTGNPSNSSPLYRFYDKKNGSHFYTASETEKNDVVARLSATYTLDGPAYDVSTQPVPGATTVYRFYDQANGSHFFTACESEKDDVIANLSATYKFDGPAFYLAP